MRDNIQGAQRRSGVNKVGVSLDRHESSVKFRIKRRAGVVANKGTEGGVRSSGAATTKAIAEKAGPADSLTRSCEPLVDGAVA